MFSKLCSTSIVFSSVGVLLLSACQSSTNDTAPVSPSKSESQELSASNATNTIVTEVNTAIDSPTVTYVNNTESNVITDVAVVIPSTQQAPDYSTDVSVDPATPVTVINHGLSPTEWVENSQHAEGVIDVSAAWTAAHASSSATYTAASPIHTTAVTDSLIATTSPIFTTTTTVMPTVTITDTATDNAQDALEESDFFYFSYDDSASTAARDLSFAYLDEQRLPPSSLGRAHEMLNAETFSFDDQLKQVEGEPFEISLAMREVSNDDLAIFKPNEDEMGYVLGVNVQGPELTQQDRDNVVLTVLLDISGSMSSSYSSIGNGESLLDVAKIALTTLADNLKDGDVVNLVTFNSAPNVILDNYLVNDDTMAYLSAIDSIYDGGSTNIARGMSKAYEVAQASFDEDKSNRVIILTDAHVTSGDFNVATIAAKTQINEQEGIYFSGIGIGSGFNENYLNAATEAGKGMYAAMVTPEDAVRLFSDDFMGFLKPAVEDIRFKLTYPTNLSRKAGAAEQVSTVASEVQTINFAYNSNQYFVEIFSADTDLDLSSEITLGYEYRSSAGNKMTQSVSISIADLISNDNDQLSAASLVLAYADLVAGKVNCEEIVFDNLLLENMEDEVYKRYRDGIQTYCEIENPNYSSYVEPLWQTANDGSVPASSLMGGYESDGRKLYICRAQYMGETYFGKVRSGFNGCNIGVEGLERPISQYETLTLEDALSTWQPVAEFDYADNVSLSGWNFMLTDEADRFICQAEYQSGLHIGTAFSNEFGCHFSWGGTEKIVYAYNILGQTELVLNY